MEDRITPGLYLELTDLSPDAYAARRVDDVLAQPEADRATWWLNQVPGRSDFRSRIGEGSVLGLFEVGPRFHAPAVGPEITTPLHFRHYRRPGQGSLTGSPTLGLLVVLISPRDEDGAQALRDWADFVHLRHITRAAVPGYTMVTPYENATADGPRFLHLYEMDTPDAEAAFASMTPLVTERLNGGPGTEPFDSWARHPQLRIDYVNTFRLAGARSRS
jgi:hypothetical protein